jgi:hypothetical protein
MVERLAREICAASLDVSGNPSQRRQSDNALIEASWRHHIPAASGVLGVLSDIDLWPIKEINEALKREGKRSAAHVLFAFFALAMNEHFHPGEKR